MKFKKTAVTLSAFAMAVGATVATAGPVAAAETGTWRAYGNTNPITSSSSKWACARTVQVTTGVAAQVCAIRSAHGTGSSVQAAVIVRNDRSGLYRAEATATLWRSVATVRLGTWNCSLSGVAADSWSVCFGRTLTNSNSVDATGSLNTKLLGNSPSV
ncbi:hypothetical protein ACH4E8_20690 [Streptomyces sp. NPDC017979]|uniref:hypothetical protein n=1 Tax=Streptomyces sp. NPDC017979 TaxID=3365024 RepID=UPI00379BE715